jgi:hypothetical protein
MPDLQVEIGLNMKGNKADLEDAGKAIAEGIKKAISRLGIGADVGEISGGAIAGATAGATVFLLGEIFQAIRDFPAVVAIMKLIKMFFFVLLLPLLAPLKILLVGWARFITDFTKFMNKYVLPAQTTGQNVNDAMVQTIWQPFVNATIDAWNRLWYNVGYGLAEAWGFLKTVPVTIAKNIIAGFAVFLSFGMWLWNLIIKPAFNWFLGIGERIWEIIKTGFQSLVDTILAWLRSLPLIGGFFKTPTSSSKATNITSNVTINNPVINKDSEINKIVKSINDNLAKVGMKNGVSYVGGFG